MTLASAYRYPFPPYPTGWYVVAASSELPSRGVLPLRYFGRDLVLFRAESGRAVLVDAHCPHMGAHLGHGGFVEGEGIRCPFHQWRFGCDGRVEDVPYQTRGALPVESLACWPVEEQSGVVLAHWSDGGRSPSWRMPAITEFGRPGWVGWQTFRWQIHMHTQELAENVPDMPHFRYVHRVPAPPEAEVKTSGHVYRQETIGRGADGGIVWRTQQTLFGLGLIVLRTPGPIPNVSLNAITPIDEETVDLRVMYVVDEGGDATTLSPAASAMLEAVASTIGDDVPIWEHKVYREKPSLVPGDGPIATLRKWARQFYEGGAESAPDRN
ncbi:MAG: Rieske 2Fe-2S domain-containing protein [Myxococcota bacterium]